MKPFAKRMLALASAAAITLTTIPAVCGTELEPVPAKITEDWAALENPAKEELVPARVRTAATAAPLTRAGLSGMAMNAYKSLTGLTDQDLGEPAELFLDTTDTDVLNAYQLGLLSEKTHGLFAPEDAVSRQDFFTTAVRLLDVLGYTYIDDISMDLSGYPDADELMAYAVQPAQVLLCIGAIDEDAPLEPTRLITAEEALVILDRVMTYFSKWELDPVAPQRYLGEEVAEFALNYVGCRYVRGGQGPRKFDCSGFVYYVYKNFGYSLKPGARNQWSILDGTIKKADLLPGDLVFFSRNGRSSGIFHVGIYIGDGQFVHAANSRKGLIVSDMSEAWYANRYLGAKRAID